MFYVYIIYSKKHKRLYIGQSTNVKRRFIEHNNGKVRSTQAFIPYEIIYEESHDTRLAARQREKYFKTPTGRRILKNLLKAEMAELVDALDSKSSASNGVSVRLRSRARTLSVS